MEYGACLQDHELRCNHLVSPEPGEAEWRVARRDGHGGIYDEHGQ